MHRDSDGNDLTFDARLRDARVALASLCTAESDTARSALRDRAASALEQATVCMNNSTAATSAFWATQWNELGRAELELAEHCLRLIAPATTHVPD